MCKNKVKGRIENNRISHIRNLLELIQIIFPCWYKYSVIRIYIFYLLKVITTLKLNPSLFKHVLFAHSNLKSVISPCCELRCTKLPPYLKISLQEICRMSILTKAINLLLDRINLYLKNTCFLRRLTYHSYYSLITTKIIFKCFLCAEH